MLSLVSDLSLHSFRNLVNICFMYADMFSLTRNQWVSSDDQEESESILKRLSPYLIDRLHVTHWFCNYVPESNSMEVYLFRATEEAKEIILSSYTGLFFGDTYWRKPEDLCFFSDNKMLLGSVAHERICYAYDNNSSFLTKVRPLGHWEEKLDAIEEQIALV